MRDPVETSLRGIPASDALARYIAVEAGKLGQICDAIGSCVVVAEALQRERQQLQFAVRLIITLPGTEFMVNREHRGDVYMALRDAFAAAGTQLREHVRRHSPRS